MDSTQLSEEDMLALKPSYVCSFQHRRHPKSAEAEAFTREFLATRWPWPSEAFKTRFLGLGVETALPLWLPYAKDHLIKAACVWIVTYFLIDDVMEQLTDEAQKVKRIFPLSLGMTRATKGDALEEVIFDIHEQCRLAGDQIELERFQETNKVNIRWMAHVLAKTKESMKAGSVPIRYDTFDEFMAQRLLEVASPVMFYIGRWLCNIAPPQAVLESPSIKAVEAIALEHGTYINDLYSLRKELVEVSEKKLVNINMICSNGVLYLSETNGCSILDAMKELEGRLGGLERCFLEASEEAKKTIGTNFGKEGLAEVEAYLEMIKLFIAGNVAWHAQAGRYNDFV